MSDTYRRIVPASLAEFCADLRIARTDEGCDRMIHEQPARVNALIAQALDETC